MSSATFTGFTAERNGVLHMSELIAAWNPDLQELASVTNMYTDRFLALLEGLSDDDVTFVPDDPDAHDHAAADLSDVALAWTIAHIVVHATASSEESAAIAAELARGVVYHGRSRYETPWQEVTTVEQCRQRLEESRRIRLSSLQMWPDTPHLENGYEPYAGAGWVNPQGAFCRGLSHEEEHQEQVASIREQLATRA